MQLKKEEGAGVFTELKKLLGAQAIMLVPLAMPWKSR